MSDDRHEGIADQEPQSPEEMSIDLNALFADCNRDLNRLFPDSRFRRFLRDLKKSQREIEGFLRRLESEGG